MYSDLLFLSSVKILKLRFKHYIRDMGDLAGIDLIYRTASPCNLTFFESVIRCSSVIVRLPRDAISPEKLFITFANF